MKALVFPGNGTPLLKEFPDPTPGPGEVLVRMRASGMCGTDLHYLRGAASYGAGADTIQGHEPCGEVEAVGANVDERLAKVGNRVMIHHYWGCQACAQCRSGWPQMCETAPARIMSATAPGSHAPFVVVPAHTLLPLPDELSYKAGATIGCATGTAWGGIKRVGNMGDTTVAVFGQGPVGLSATMFAAAMGARVIAVDVASSRLQLARTLGADEAVNSAEGGLSEIVGDLTHGLGVDVVIETSGRAGDDALSVLGRWGRGCFIGLPGEVRFSVQQYVMKQWTLMTSWSMSTIEQARCADFVVAHQLPVDDLFSRSWTLDQATEAYEWFGKGSEGKGVFEF